MCTLMSVYSYTDEKKDIIRERTAASTPVFKIGTDFLENVTNIVGA